VGLFVDRWISASASSTEKALLHRSIDNGLGRLQRSNERGNTMRDVVHQSPLSFCRDDFAISTIHAARSGTAFGVAAEVPLFERAKPNEINCSG